MSEEKEKSFKVYKKFVEAILVFCLVPNFNTTNESHYRPKMPYVIVEGILSSSSGDLNFARPSSSGGSTPDRKPAFQVAVSGLKGNFF